MQQMAQASGAIYGVSGTWSHEELHSVIQSVLAKRFPPLKLTAN
jgi:hypothetical protein